MCLVVLLVAFCHVVTTVSIILSIYQQIKCYEIERQNSCYWRYGSGMVYLHWCIGICKRSVMENI